MKGNWDPINSLGPKRQQLGELRLLFCDTNTRYRTKVFVFGCFFFLFLLLNMFFVGKSWVLNQLLNWTSFSSRTGFQRHKELLQTWLVLELNKSGHHRISFTIPVINISCLVSLSSGFEISSTKPYVICPHNSPSVFSFKPKACHLFQFPS